VELDPSNPKSYNNRGALLLKMCKYSEAFADFEHALELQPEYEVARRNLEVARERRAKQMDSVAARGAQLYERRASGGDAMATKVLAHLTYSLVKAFRVSDLRLREAIAVRDGEEARARSAREQARALDASRDLVMTAEESGGGLPVVPSDRSARDRWSDLAPDSIADKLVRTRLLAARAVDLSYSAMTKTLN
jgi:tetratricopeptide (TPR) repeat protein